ncbi:hypothetical protein HY68_05700 [Streptomyces sp. AcH 505]|uniref:hypothetical protein n=1 Tax=unclassified Streptomyces TaxID=2593676 RepID=UPI00059204A6|nr:hypothetical protein [Streptomyces sp. NBC_00370]KIF68243.1 hypothetical protein HY68_05700 [Streptomyces sp. AcH 505]
MINSERKEAEVRRMLDLPHPAVPTDLLLRATARGARMLHRRRTLRRVLWTLLLAAAVVFVVWAAATYPWEPQPTEMTPPPFGF